MANLAEVSQTIRDNIDKFRAPGVLAVRPGYPMRSGWPSGDPRIVALVGQKKGDASAHGLPNEVAGIPVEVREATALERLKVNQPQTYSAMQAVARPEYRGPDFPGERILAGGPAPLARGPAKPQIPYQPASPPLAPITDDFQILCHASPDAGWPTLKDFFGRIDKRLTVGLYDFTSAHILDGLDAALVDDRHDRDLCLVLDHPKRNPTADQTDEDTRQKLSGALGQNLAFAWAPVRSSSEVSEWIFPSAYHIKVAVRDGQEMWLSSGNWNNSNQPEKAPADDPDPASAAETFKASDRDWHVIIPHAGLAELFEAYLNSDRQEALPAQGRTVADATVKAFAEDAGDLAEVHPLAVAKAPGKYFQPATIKGRMTIQPLLTPDQAEGGGIGLYVSEMLKLISGAQRTLDIQLQYMHPSNNGDDADFTALLDAVAKKQQQQGFVVRIILSQWQNSQWMERLQAAGIDTADVKIQNGVHNKGFIIDGETVVISSQNWSGDGTLRNRDAGLIISSRDVAQYFAQIFEEDWAMAAGKPGAEG